MWTMFEAPIEIAQSIGIRIQDQQILNDENADFAG